MTTSVGKVLRPGTLGDFQGQPDVVTQLRVLIGAAKTRQEPVIPHTLFAGPPGLGKTTLAGVIAHELDIEMLTTTGPAITKPGDVAALLVSLVTPSVVFVDEIHQIPTEAQEMLYSAMEDGRVDIIVGEGTGNVSTYSFDVAPFTLVGATTEAGRLVRPFLDRFGYVGRLEPYDEEVLTKIVQRSASVWDLSITTEAAKLIAGRARGTPRVANQLLGRVRDVVNLAGSQHITPTEVDDALKVFGIDTMGLGKVDRQILHSLIHDFAGGPVGVETLAAAIGEAPGTVAGNHEPYLMQCGFIQRTSRGRVATFKARRYLKQTT